MPTGPRSPPWRPLFAGDSSLHASIATAAASLRDCAVWPSLATLDARIAPQTVRAGGAAPGVRFVDDPGRSRRPRRGGERTLDSLYDGRIALRREVPTRSTDWHDLLNALVWASFPRAKWQLSARQCRVHRARVGERFERLPPCRTPEQDALALLDEGAVLFVVDEARAAATHRAVDESDCAWLAGEARDGAMRVLLFGHAQHEHLVRGDRSARAGAVVLPVCGEPRTMSHDALLDAADEALAALLGDPRCFAERPSAKGILLGEIERWVGGTVSTFQHFGHTGIAPSRDA